MFDSQVQHWHSHLTLIIPGCSYEAVLAVCVSLARHHIATFAVGMQSEGVSRWEVGGQRVYKESNE